MIEFPHYKVDYKHKNFCIVEIGYDNSISIVRTNLFEVRETFLGEGFGYSYDVIIRRVNGVFNYRILYFGDTFEDLRNAYYDELRRHNQEEDYVSPVILQALLLRNLKT